MHDAIAAFDRFVQTTWLVQLGYLHELKLAGAVLVVPVLRQPGILLGVADGAADFEAVGQELFDDVAADEAIDACDKDERAGW